MFLKSLSLVQFKNYAQAEFSLSPGINCFVGRNGKGKTTVLDAVHYLSMCRSYLNSVDKQNIRFGDQFFVIQGIWDKEGKETEIYCGVKAGSKKVFKRNKTEYDKLADHIGQFPSVVISPYDRDLISEGSEVRRKWMDGIISQFDRSYLDALVRYGKVLEQRNALLKHFYENGFFERESMDVWDEQLHLVGTAIFEKRKAFLTDFIPVFQKYYTFLAHDNEQVDLAYKSQLLEVPLKQLLEQNRRRDGQLLYTSSGIHKDDLLFSIHDYPVKKFGSQGQQKSFLIALRLAQFEWLNLHLGMKPILMLDDIFDKLDNERVSKLMRLVSDNVFGQVLVTDTEMDRIAHIFETCGLDYQAIDVEKIEQIIPENHG